MTMPIRVAFAGLAHSHPYADAEGALALGAEVVAVHDGDAAVRSDFAERFGGIACDSLSALAAASPDIIVATPLPHESVPFLGALTGADARVPVFFNKVVAATPDQLAQWEGVISQATVPVGTASVLHFAPTLGQLAAKIDQSGVLGIRVRVQHDNAGFQRPDRAWQDDPVGGGGTLVTVGAHAWEMIDVILPGAAIDSGSGWTRTRSGSTTRSEDAGGFNGVLRVGAARVPVDVVVTGLPGPDAYGVEVLTESGLQQLEIDVTSPRDALGYSGLVRALLAGAADGTAPAPWGQSEAVVRNTVRAADLVRRASDCT